jgi:membrane protease subunit HflC
MKKPAILFGALGLAVVLLILVVSSVFVVDETEQAVVQRFGRPVHVIVGDRAGDTFAAIEKAVKDASKEEGTEIKISRGAGFYFKTPFVEDVKIFDDRILEYDSKPADIVTKDKKQLKVDNFARWRIENPFLFLRRVQDETAAQPRLDDVIFSALREHLSKAHMVEIVRSSNRVLEENPDLETIPVREGFGRDEIMERVTAQAEEQLAQYGMRVIDVRIKRAELLPRNEQAVYERMSAERRRISDQNRAEGKKEQQKIQAEADKQVQIILADAEKGAQILLGEGEAEAAAIYAAAYEAHREFYSFKRGLEALELSIGTNTRLVLGTDSPVFRYLKDLEK